MIAQDFQVPYAVIQQALTLYLVVSALVQVFIGPLSDRFGRRPVLQIAFLLFLLATLGTILAPNATIFLICRMAQAAVAAGMVLSRAIVRDMVEESEAASMIAYVTMGMSLVPMISPMIGGALDSIFGWRTSFAFMLLIAGGTYFLLHKDLGETNTPKPGFTLWDQFRSYPKLLSSTKFWLYALMAALSSGCMFAYLGGAPLIGSEFYGLSPFWVGVGFGTPAVGYLVGNFIAGRISSKVGINRMILIGVAATALPLVMLTGITALGLNNEVIFFGGMCFIGLGNGLCLPNANAGMVSARPGMAGSAAGLGGALMMAIGALMAGITGVLLQNSSSELPMLILMSGSSLVAMFAALIWEKISK